MELIIRNGKENDAAWIASETIPEFPTKREFLSLSYFIRHMWVWSVKSDLGSEAVGSLTEGKEEIIVEQSFHQSRRSHSPGTLQGPRDYEEGENDGYDDDREKIQEECRME